MNEMITKQMEESQGGMVAKPRQSMEVAESSRVLAETKAALEMAALRPRDETYCIQRIKNSCGRKKLAEGACYEFQRGGTTITGASIRLMEVIAQNWGNLRWGFREIAQGNGESTVEAFAWDCETNSVSH